MREKYWLLTLQFLDMDKMLLFRSSNKMSEILILCQVRSGYNATIVKKLMSEIYK